MDGNLVDLAHFGMYGRRMTERHEVTEPELMTPKEAAEALHVSTKTVQRIADQGSVGFVRLPSGHRRYVRAEIVELANAQHATTSEVAAS